MLPVVEVRHVKPTRKLGALGAVQKPAGRGRAGRAGVACPSPGVGRLPKAGARSGPAPSAAGAAAPLPCASRLSTPPFSSPPMPDRPLAHCPPAIHELCVPPCTSSPRRKWRKWPALLPQNISFPLRFSQGTPRPVPPRPAPRAPVVLMVPVQLNGDGYGWQDDLQSRL